VCGLHLIRWTKNAISLAAAELMWNRSLLLEARPCAGESDAQIVAGAWDFDRINRRYATHAKILGERPRAALRDESGAKALLRWAVAEREAWLDAVKHDPLLPTRLLPPGYLGRQAWRRRVELARHASRQLRTFNTPAN
jgi:DNA-binding transcriptional regulator PaaX